MFFDNREKRKQLAKWVIGVIAACILIFLGVRYISSDRRGIGAHLERTAWYV